MRHLLPVHGPLDLELTFRCGQAFRWRAKDGAWSGVVGLSEARIAWEQSADLLAAEVVGDDRGSPDWSRYLRLEEDPAIHLEGAEELRTLPGFEALLGLRLLRQDPWETLASFICSAAANIPKITACVEGLADSFGAPIPGSSRRAFPSPVALARAGEDDLRALGLGFRAPFLLETARQLARDPLDWEELRHSPIEEARARLLHFPGVGSKIADCVLLFGLDRMDAYPLDRWIRRATLEMSGRPRARDRELDEWALRLGPGRGYLQQLLFHLRRTGGPLPRLRVTPARRPRKRPVDGAIALFAKVPEPGRVKTRLVPPLTPEEAASIARACLEETLRRFPPRIEASWALFLDGAPDPPLATLAAKAGIAVEQQGKGDLGARLARAFRRLRAGGARRVVAIGSDSPTLDPVRIEEAFEALRRADVVIGPTADGGYYLIGARVPLAGLLRDIPWSTDEVAETTAQRAIERGLKVEVLAAWYDLDEVSDLRRAAGDAGDCPILATALEALGERLGEGATPATRTGRSL